MKQMSVLVCVSGLLFFVGGANAVVLTAPCGKLELDNENGSIRSVVPVVSSASVWSSGTNGLWQITFADQTTLSSATFHPDDEINRFRMSSYSPESCILSYAAPAVTVQVEVTAAPEGRGFDFRATVKNNAQSILSLALPCELRFSPNDVRRLIFPQDGNVGLGVAWNSLFFSDHSNAMDAGWESQVIGPRGYNRIFGDALNYRDVHDPEVPVSVTEEGHRWFSPATEEKLSRHAVVANRASRSGQYDRVLLDTQHGPFFAASALGGNGALWRFGGPIRQEDREVATITVEAVLSRLASHQDGIRKTISLISLYNGPRISGWSSVAVTDWREIMSRVAKQTNAEFRELKTPKDVSSALSNPNVLCVLNPYGENLPVDPNFGYDRMLDKIRAFVQAGGNWFETAAFSFHYQFRPRKYLRYEVPYPPAFADFMRLESCNGIAALYRVQPRTAKEPWQWASSDFFLPGSIWCAGTPDGGACGRSFSVCIKNGSSFTFPVVRMTFGQHSAEADLKAYSADNALTRKLEDKIKPTVLAKLCQSPLLKLNSNASDLIRFTPSIPSPSLIHFCDYLKGGFDKEYPDHLPPNQRFGTAEQLSEFFKVARASGHLLCPYTNPTWWCDHPKGPSFESAGDVALLRQLDGQPRREVYAKNDGWTITYWHPAVRQANRKTVREFTVDYPVDLLFQDQCGARRWLYDTNSSSPDPAAYIEGMLNMNDEDSRNVPIGTENGWDRTANFQTMLCGLSWGHVPTPGRTWQWYFKERYPVSCWEMYPIALWMFHENCIFTHHDLGQFVMPGRYDTLVWTLATGYGLSFVSNAKSLVEQENIRRWYELLSRLQKSVCARYIGQPLISFVHDRSALVKRGMPLDDVSDDGVIRAQFGPVRIFANLGNVPRELDGHPLAPYGFWINEPGRFTASRLENQPVVITEGNSTWQWNQ